jgi:hypothetical protein
MKTKITSKNKNVINIKINTEKKKGKRQKRRPASSPKGRSSYNTGGYSMMPPIIIQPSTPQMPFQSAQPIQFINPPTSSSNSINVIPDRVAETPQPPPPPRHQNIPVAEVVTPFINSSNTVPEPIGKSVRKKLRLYKTRRNDDFINSPSNIPVALGEEINDEASKRFEKYYTPLKDTENTPNLDTISNMYDNNDEEEILYTNPLLTVKDISKENEVPSPTGSNTAEKKRIKRNEMQRARYYNKTDDFTEEKFNTLLDEWYSLNPNEKADADFAGKKPSKSLYAKLMGKVNLAKRKKPAPVIEPDTQQDENDNVPVELPKKKKKKKIVVIDK